MRQPEVNEEIKKGGKGIVALFRGLKRAIDGLFDGVVYLFKGLVLLAVIALIGAGIYLFVNKGGGSSTSTQTTTTSVTSKSVSGTTGSQSSGSSQPSPSDAPQAASSVTAADWLVGTQMMNLQNAITDCGYSVPVLKMNVTQEAKYCQDPQNLELGGHGGFTWGSGPDQVVAALSVQTATSKVAHHVTFGDGHTGVTYSTKNAQTVQYTLTGKTADGSVLTLAAPGTQFVTNDQGQVVFWIGSGLNAPCSQQYNAAYCLVQPTSFNLPNHQPDQWKQRIVYAKTVQ